jgi:hypothetical protein
VPREERVDIVTFTAELAVQSEAIISSVDPNTAISATEN